MPTVPLWMLGKHLVSVVITGQAVSAGGVFSDGSSVTITTVMSSLQLQLTPSREEINALNTVRENEVVLSDGASLDIEVIKVNNGGDPAPLKTLVGSYDYFKVVWTEGTGASAKVNTFYGVRGPYSDGFRGRGAAIANLQLGPCDVGAAQLTVAAP